MDVDFMVEDVTYGEEKGYKIELETDSDSYNFVRFLEKIEDRKKKFILARTFEFFINQVYQVYYGL